MYKIWTKNKYVTDKKKRQTSELQAPDLAHGTGTHTSSGVTVQHKNEL